MNFQNRKVLYFKQFIKLTAYQNVSGKKICQRRVYSKILHLEIAILEKQYWFQYASLFF